MSRDCGRPPIGAEPAWRNTAAVSSFLTAYVAIRLALRGADFGEWVAEAVNQILFIGFFLALLTHSSGWASAIVARFREAANPYLDAWREWNERYGGYIAAATSWRRCVCAALAIAAVASAAA